MFEYKDQLRLKTNPKTGEPISAGTLRNYNTTISRLKRYEVHKKTVLQVHDIDLTFHTDYKKFATHELILSKNSISKDFKQVKTVCTDASDRGYSINEQVLSLKFNAPTE
jgi:hypothetical protein